MTIDIPTVLGAGAAVITACGGVYTVVRHMFYASKSKKEQYKQGILKEAKEEMCKIEAGLTEKIKNLEMDLNAHKDSISQEMLHIQEKYSLEVRTLGEKINDIRDQLNQQHSQLVALLTRMIDIK